MKRTALIIALSILSLNTILSQFIIDPVLKTLDNRKEIKIYHGEDYLKQKEYFDKQGNLIFSKAYNQKGEVVSVEFNEYTDKGDLAMRISTNTFSPNLELLFIDFSEKGIAKTYKNSKWDRKPYDPRTKKFLQKIKTTEDLLKHKDVKKLIKGRGKLIGVANLDSLGRRIKEGTENKKTLFSGMSYKYDESGNMVESNWISWEQEKEVKNKVINEYDASGNLLTIKTMELIQNDKGEKWVVRGNTQRKYNDRNQLIESISTSSFKDKPTTVRKSINNYDNHSRLTKMIKFNENGEKTHETNYDYRDKQTIQKQMINYEELKNEPEYEPYTVIYKVEYYED